MESNESGKKYRPKKSLMNSFNHAINGFLQSFKMERNMKIHVALAVVVTIAALLTQVTRFEMIALVLVIAFVFFAELFNTAIEAAVDIASKGEYNELARIAKDVAAGGVFVAAMSALVVGYLVFFRKLYTISYASVSYINNLPAYITFAALMLVFVAVIVMKSRFMKKGGNYIQGGMPSGHTAFAFALFTAIAFVSADPVASTFAAVLALIVAESRMETKVHTFAEVLVGALMGVVITVLVFEVGEMIIR